MMKLRISQIRLIIFCISPILILSIATLYNQTFFSTTDLPKGFIDDIPALLLLSIGFIILPVLLHSFSKLHMAFNNSRYKTIELVAVLLLSLLTNHLWVSSQLSNNVISWITYKGSIPYLYPTVKLFNLPGLIYWICCVIYWSMYFKIFLVFIKLFVKVSDIRSLFYKKDTSFTQAFSKTDFKNFFISSTVFFTYSFFYYLILQISDFIIEGTGTMDMHPNRLIILTFVILLMLSYNTITTVIHFYNSPYNENSHDISAVFYQYEIRLDLIFALAPGLIFFIYYLFSTHILADESLEFKNSLIFFVFLVIIAISIINQLSKQRRIDNYKMIQNENSNLQIYAKTVDKLYLGVSHYKHDITNTLLSFKTYIDEKNYDELEVFYNEHIINNAPINDSNYEFLTVMSSINNMSLKGLLLYKFSIAEHLGLSLDLEIMDTMEDLSINDVLLCRVIGILMDNAIEASSLSNQKTILFSMILEHGNFEITIGNSYKGLPEINHIFDFNKSSKGEHRGIGLHSLTSILKSHPTINLETSITKDWFLQKLIFEI